MQHWLDIYYTRTRGVGKADGITYSSPTYGQQKMSPVTQSSNMPIAEQQGKDANTAAITTGTRDKSGQLVLKGYAGDLYTALDEAGLPARILQWAIPQLYMESGGYSNGPAVKDNNPGNIIWFAGQQKGVYMPANKTYATHFKDLDAFAKVYYQLLTKGPGNPADATSLEDFVHRLKLNGYYGKESEASYLKKMQNTMSRLNMLDKTYKAATKKMMADSHPPFWKQHPYLAGGLAVLGALVVVKIIR